jgi:hypothetical protein
MIFSGDLSPDVGKGAIYIKWLSREMTEAKGATMCCNAQSSLHNNKSPVQNMVIGGVKNFF